MTLDKILEYSWAALMIILFFGGSIFIHELGHFLAAKWRGLVIERFSIGFGPRLFGWTRNGIDYRVSLLPLGGYVALPQLADMRGIEGETSLENASMEPISYTSKIIVSVAGAVFNVLFALVLGLILWKTGVEREYATTIGAISESVEIEEGHFVDNPAFKAGLKVGDEIISIDSQPVGSFEDIFINVVLGSGMSDDGKRVTKVEYIRNSETSVAIVHPILHPDHQMRMIGIQPNMYTIIAAVSDSFPAKESGLQFGDIVKQVNGITVFSSQHFTSIIKELGNDELELKIARINPNPGGPEYTEETISITPVLSKLNTSDDQFYAIGASLASRIQTQNVHINPIGLSKDVIDKTYKTIKSLLNSNSDAKMKDMSGPVGIANIIAKTSTVGIVRVMEIALMINISLAIFNLLPIPVLDGGHIAFATIAKITGKPIPPNFAAAIQGSFMLLLFSFMIYVTWHDIGRTFVKDKTEPGPAVYLIKVEEPPV
jgi:regulator of sigma E protease